MSVTIKQQGNITKETADLIKEMQEEIVPFVGFSIVDLVDISLYADKYISTYLPESIDGGAASYVTNAVGGGIQEAVDNGVRFYAVVDAEFVEVSIQAIYDTEDPESVISLEITADGVEQVDWVAVEDTMYNAQCYTMGDSPAYVDVEWTAIADE